MAHHDNISAHDEHHEGLDAKKIWSVFFILLALTALEFLIALGFVHHWGILQKGMLVNTIYIALTLVKAYYIVAYFMHLKFEKSGFIISSSIGFIFIVYFIVLMLTEGSHLFEAFQSHPIFQNN